MTKIQGALGKNAKTKWPDIDYQNAKFADVGQVVVDAVGEYISHYLSCDDGEQLVDSIYSENLRSSAGFSARNARIAYLLGKVAILNSKERKGVVRMQIIEYGSIAEAILLDIVQSVGVQNNPKDMRTKLDKSKKPINWDGDGLYSMNGGSKSQVKYYYDFHWLINESSRIQIIDDSLKTRLHNLRKSRNPGREHEQILITLLWTLCSGT